jgi:hypothetical protein
VTNALLQQMPLDLVEDLHAARPVKTTKNVVLNCSVVLVIAFAWTHQPLWLGVRTAMLTLLLLLLLLLLTLKMLVTVELKILITKMKILWMTKMKILWMTKMKILWMTKMKILLLIVKTPQRTEMRIATIGLLRQAYAKAIKLS